MNPDRILIGQIGIVLIEIVLTQWFATQWTAKALGYQPALGAPWLAVGDRPVYLPWRLFQWWCQ